MRRDATNILKRHPRNPILDPRDYPGVMALYNPGVAAYGDETILLVSVLTYKEPETFPGVRDNGKTWIARSKDGVNFDLEDNSFIELGKLGPPYETHYRHAIDSRVTKIDDAYYIASPVGATGGHLGPATVLGKTTDFKSYEPMGIIALPPNRGVSLFPGKVNGKYYRLDRPGAGTGSLGHIWISSSPDLLNWGEHQPLLMPSNSWSMSKIGPTPPIRTSEGWLVIIHGVSIPCDGTHYYVGAALLDLEEPWKVIGKTSSWLLAAEEDYETRGLVDNVVFPCGALANEAKDELRLYYGAADTRIGLASGSLKDIVDACKEEL
jgi:predicted GH43/DUF377 family glycosyl hydrolase